MVTVGPWHLLILAALTGLGLTLVSMPIFLRWAQGHGWGQEVRSEGPQAHLSKAGTPTMGGIVLIASALVGSFWAPSSWEAWLLRLVVVLCACLGMMDDGRKLLRHQSLGLKARHKLAFLAGVGLLLWGWLYATRSPLGLEIPHWGIVGGAGLSLVVTLLLTMGTVNAVNLTDGLDGLSSSTCSVALGAYALICLQQGELSLAVTACAFLGACLGFLWYNSYPAQVFMGDTGSLALGGALAALALLSGTELLLIVIGGVFVAEALSVIIQVTYFKLSGGKRVFRMSPLHHHFELGGWPEVKVTVCFTIAAFLLALLGLWLHVGGWL